MLNFISDSEFHHVMSRVLRLLSETKLGLVLLKIDLFKQASSLNGVGICSMYLHTKSKVISTNFAKQVVTHLMQGWRKQ